MGLPVSLPVVISPTGVQAVHSDGEIAVTRAAAARGALMCLSRTSQASPSKRSSRPAWLRALLLSRLGRHPEGLAASAEQLELAERMDSPEPLAQAGHDAGLTALPPGDTRTPQRCSTPP